MKLNEGFAELRKNLVERKFDQTAELIVNLRGIDMKRDNVSLVATLPHKVKERRICAFLSEKSKLVSTITKPEFGKFKDKKELKKFINQYDSFISAAALMPSVATTFGKVLGPSGKMPSPQLGLLTQENDNAIKEMLERVTRSVKVRMKEASIKIAIGKLSMDDKMLVENAQAAYTAIIAALPNKKESVRNVSVRFSMSKPVRVEVQ